MSAASTPSEAQSAAVTPVMGPPKQPAAMLVMSGGEGYIDFRIGKVYLRFSFFCFASAFYCRAKRFLGISRVVQGRWRFLKLRFKFTFLSN